METITRIVISASLGDPYSIALVVLVVLAGVTVVTWTWALVLRRFLP